MAILSGIVLYLFLTRLTTVFLMLKSNRELNPKKHNRNSFFNIMYLYCIKKAIIEFI